MSKSVEKAKERIHARWALADELEAIVKSIQYLYWETPKPKLVWRGFSLKRVCPDCGSDIRVRVADQYESGWGITEYKVWECIHCDYVLGRSHYKG